METDAATAPAQPSLPMLDFLRAMSMLALVGIAGLTALSYLGAYVYPFDLISHFRPFLAIGAFALALILLLLRRRRTAVLAAFVCAAGLAGVIPSGTAPVATAAPSARTLSVVTLNLWGRNRRLPDVVRYLEETDADVIVLQEYGRQATSVLKQLKGRYPWQLNCVRKTRCDIAILSKRKWQASGSLGSAPDRAPLAWVTFGKGSNAYTVAGVHLARPPAQRHIEQIETLAAWIAKRPAPVILAGDFNATPWSYALAQFRRKSKLRILAGTRPSWPAAFGYPVLPIDHVFVSRGIENLGASLGPRVGSDHLPVIAKLGIGQ